MSHDHAQELFALEPDDRLDKLRDWIKYQWAFKFWYFFWPTKAPRHLNE